MANNNDPPRDPSAPAHDELVDRLRSAAQVDGPATHLRRAIGALKAAGADRRVVWAFLQYAADMLRAGIDEPYEGVDQAVLAMDDAGVPRPAIAAALVDAGETGAGAADQLLGRLRTRIAKARRECVLAEPQHDPFEEIDLAITLNEFCALREIGERSRPGYTTFAFTPLTDDVGWPSFEAGRVGVQQRIRAACWKTILAFRGTRRGVSAEN